MRKSQSLDPTISSDRRLRSVGASRHRHVNKDRPASRFIQGVQ
jgi:hypothetical protein